MPCVFPQSTRSDLDYQRGKRVRLETTVLGIVIKHEHPELSRGPDVPQAALYPLELCRRLDVCGRPWRLTFFKALSSTFTVASSAEVESVGLLSAAEAVAIPSGGSVDWVESRVVIVAKVSVGWELSRSSVSSADAWSSGLVISRTASAE